MIQDVLKNCIVEGNVIKLPDGQLDRKVYTEVKKSLELIGGKWKGGKTYGFVFEEDPSELLSQIANGEQRNLKKEYQFFATPPVIANLMAEELTDRISFTDRILEPSAGGVINWSWWFVTLPIWGGFLFWVLLVIIIILISK